jgi:LysM repeat protein
MNKKFFIIGLTVLLGVSLFLTGCPTDADGDDSPGGNWYDALGSDTVTGADPLNEDLTVPAGETLTVSGTLTVASGVTLTVDEGGTLTVTGTLKGTDGTSQLVLGANVTSTVAEVSLSEGTYLWAAGAWLDQVTVTTAVTTALTNLGMSNVEADPEDPTKIKLKESATFSGSPEILAGVTLAVPEGRTLSVNDSVTFTVTGAIEVAASGEITVVSGGTLAVAGTLEVAGTLTIPENGEVVVESGGEYVLALGASGTNAGTITIESGGSTWGKGGNIAGTGVNVIEKGGKAYLGGDNEAARTYMIGHEVVEAGVAANIAPIIQLMVDGTELAFNNAGFELNGTATLNGMLDGNYHFTVESPQTLKIGEGSTLTIPTASNEGYTMLWLKAANSSSTPLVLGADGAQIVLGAMGHIYFKEGSTDFPSLNGNETWNNFYDNPTTKITSGLSHGNETYVWSTTLGSDSNESGWLKQ